MTFSPHSEAPASARPWSAKPGFVRRASEEGVALAQPPRRSRASPTKCVTKLELGDEGRGRRALGGATPRVPGSTRVPRVGEGVPAFANFRGVGPRARSSCASGRVRCGKRLRRGRTRPAKFVSARRRNQHAGRARSPDSRCALIQSRVGSPSLDGCAFPLVPKLQLRHALVCEARLREASLGGRRSAGPATPEKPSFAAQVRHQAGAW